MAGRKRASASELNHENWDQDEEEEEVGDFKQASPDEIKRRIFKKPVRRFKPIAQKNESIFGNLGSLVAPTPIEKHNPFSFLGKQSPDKSTSFSKVANFALSGTSSTGKTPADTPFSFFKTQTTPSFGLPVEMSLTQPVNTQNPFSSIGSNVRSGGCEMINKPTSYLSKKLQELNKTFIKTIQNEVDKDPASILSRCFKDYVSQVEKLHNKEATEDSECGKMKGSEVELPISIGLPAYIPATISSDNGSRNSLDLSDSQISRRFSGGSMEPVASANGKPSEHGGTIIPGNHISGYQHFE